MKATIHILIFLLIGTLLACKNNPGTPDLTPVVQFPNCAGELQPWLVLPTDSCRTLPFPPRPPISEPPQNERFSYSNPRANPENPNELIVARLEEFTITQNGSTWPASDGNFIKINLCTGVSTVFKPASFYFDYGPNDWVVLNTSNGVSKMKSNGDSLTFLAHGNLPHWDVANRRILISRYDPIVLSYWLWIDEQGKEISGDWIENLEGYPRLSPNGKRALFVITGEGLYLHDFEAGTSILITSPVASQGYKYLTGYNWVDDETIVILGGMEGKGGPGRPIDDGAIFTLHLPTGLETFVKQACYEPYYGQPEVSSDGKYLFLTRILVDDSSSFTSQMLIDMKIAVMDLDGENERVIMLPEP